ncbi:MAG: CDF family Co(II)/Ni(II) efflux transporter DmeF [Bacteriovoracaceae bacterium]
MHKQCSIEQRDTHVFLSNENKTKWVTVISLVTMVVEIVAGYWSGSMALLADGWHMASHTLALALSLFVYYLYRNPKFRSSFTFGGGKILSLGGYTSSLFLIFIAGSMIVESALRFYEKPVIHYDQALWVAGIGLIVNLICAYILQHKADELPEPHHHHHDHSQCSHNKLGPVQNQHQHHHHHHHHHDHNHAGAYMHILTDALTSVFAILALLFGKWQNWNWLDPLVGIVGGVVVLKWAIGLLHQSGMDLLDAHDSSVDRENLIKKLEEDGSSVVDLHLWRLAPGQIGCELVIKSSKSQNSADYRDLIQEEYNIQHLIIEVV